MERILTDIFHSLAWLLVAPLLAFCGGYVAIRALSFLVSVVRKRLFSATGAALLALALGLLPTIAKRNAGESTGVSLPREESPVWEAALSPLQETFRIEAIAVHSNGAVTLTAAWPIDFLTVGQTLDVLGKENLHDETWMWLTNGVITTGATNISFALESQSPSNYFYKVVVRESLTDMDDPDCDGIPNVYELHHGTNPWMPDSSLVPKLTVGTNETYTTISTALAASMPYSVIEIAPGMYSGVGWSGVALPEHPVLITGSGKRPVIRGDSFATFLLPSNSTEQTLLRNLSIDLGGRGGLRAGFWCGGNLPWSGQTASATFDNIYVRMPDSDAQYYGWIFYRSSTNRVVLSRCAVNAAGARDAVGVFAIDPSPISVENCTFANFPSNASGCRGAALLLKTSVQNYGCVSSEVEVTVAGSVFDDSFTDALPLARFEEGTNFIVRMQNCALPHALKSPYLPDYSSSLWVTNGQTAWSGHALVDSLVADLGLGALPILGNDSSTDTDDDGLSDYEEVYERGTDPYLSDSNNDGVPDGVEVHIDETDPTDPHSFTQTLTVSVTNTVSTAYAVYTAWGGSERAWEANEQVMFPQGFGDTPYTNASPHGATHVKAFCDLNGNGEYDASIDILLMRQIPTGSATQINFIFGDVDGDGVSDAQERSEETDPYDGGSFRLVTTVNVASSDVVPGLTNYVAWGYVPEGWETNNLTPFAGSGLVFPVAEVATNGELFVKVFRDFNANGIYDDDVDALVSNKLTCVDNRKTVTFKIGDSDGDGVVDSVEMAEGTDPLGSRSCCFWMSAEVTGIFHTTNSLTLSVAFGDATLYAPAVVASNAWNMDFGHLLATNGEKVVLTIWDDANSNLVCDAEETFYRRDLDPTGHVNVISFNMPHGRFDRDGNSIPDWWEVQEGLSIEGVARRAYDDPDGDGLINLHEYWCGTHPLVPDGSNTLLSVVARAIDDRIRGVAPATAIHRFVNYFANGSNGVFQLNANFWARDLDLSCVSVWHPEDYPGSKAATLITRRHIIMADHWPAGSYTFCDTNGTVLTRAVVDRKRISDDLRLGLLNEPLPDTFKPAHVPSTNIAHYISTGRYLPTLCLNQEKGATVLELVAWDCETMDKYGNHYRHYGYTSQTNLVMAQRCNVRAATVDGNSGCPVFLVVGGKLVLLFSKHLGYQDTETWSPSWGPSPSFRLDAIQNKINEWEGDNAGLYQIVPFDPSSFDGITNQ